MTKMAEMSLSQWRAWKSQLVPLLYDWFMNHKLVWPSQACRWAGGSCGTCTADVLAGVANKRGQCATWQQARSSSKMDLAHRTGTLTVENLHENMQLVAVDLQDHSLLQSKLALSYMLDNNQHHGGLLQTEQQHTP